MTITLATLPIFLRRTFPATRSLLIGVTITVVPIASVTPLTAVKTQPRLPLTMTRFVKSRAAQLFLSLVIATSFMIAAILIAPSLYYAVFPADTEPVVTLEEGTPLGGSFAEKSQENQQAEATRVLPPQDATLPEGTWLIVPRIGIRTQLDPNLSTDEALAKGVWMAPEYGAPGDLTQPVILAAHRFGWKWWWQSDYWKYHSFYLLPELQPGDFVEVIDDQRKYTYEIYAGEEGEDITDYSADMILYTCKFLNSPVRHFRYARIIDVSKDTQALAT